MAKIITVTANTAIDFFIEVAGLAHDVAKAQRSAQFAGGKGVNVGKAVAALDCPVLCQGFVGKQSMAAFNALATANLHTDFTLVDGKTRTNLTLSDTVANRQTHIITQGFSVTDADCRQLANSLAATLSAGDSVIFSGSLPPGAPDNSYATLIGLCHRKGALPFLDSSGQGLKEGIQALPYLIKPNQSEFEQIMGSVLATEQAVVTAARQLLAQGIAWVCVSRGEQGLVMVGKHLALSARTNNLPNTLLNTVGCGDALLAGLVVAIKQGRVVEDCARLAVACGTANLSVAEPGRFDPYLVQEIYKKVEIVRLAV